MSGKKNAEVVQNEADEQFQPSKSPYESIDQAKKVLATLPSWEEKRKFLLGILEILS